MAVTSSAFATRQARRDHARFDVISAGSALSLFFLLTYALVVVGYLVDPHLPLARALMQAFIPGATQMSASDMFGGAIFAFAWGWYIAVVGVPLYNFFLARKGAPRD